MASRYRSAVWHDQIRTMSRGVGRTGGGLVICERVGSHDRWNVEVGRDPYTHMTGRAACGSIPAVRKARSMKTLAFVCEVNAGMRVATAHAR